MKKFITNSSVAIALIAMVFITNSIFAQTTTTLGGYKVFTNGKANNFIVPESTYKGKAAYPKTGADIAQAFDSYERAPFFRLTSKEHILVLIIGFNNSVRVISKAMGITTIDTIAHNNYRRMIEVIGQSKRERYTYPLGTLFAALDPKDSTVVWISIPNDSLRNSLVFYTPDNIRIPVAHWECGAQPPFLEDLTETEKCLIKIDTVTVTNNLKAPPPPIIPPAPQNVVNDTCCDTYTTNNYYYYGATQAPQQQFVDYGYRQSRPLNWGWDYNNCGYAQNYSSYYQPYDDCYDCGDDYFGFSVHFGSGHSNNHGCSTCDHQYSGPCWDYEHNEPGYSYYNNVVTTYNYTYVDNSVHVDDHSVHTTTTTTTTTTGTTPGTGPVIVYPDPVTPGGTTDPNSGTTTVTSDDGGNTNPTSDGGGGTTDPSSSHKTDETSFITPDGKLRKQSTEITYKKNGQVKAISTKYSEVPATQADIMKYGTKKQQVEMVSKPNQPKQEMLANAKPLTQQPRVNEAQARWNAQQGFEQKVTPQSNNGQKQNVQQPTQQFNANGSKIPATASTNVVNRNVSTQKYDATGRKISNEQSLALANTNSTNNDVRLNNGNRGETQRNGLTNSSQNLTKGNGSNFSDRNQQVELSNRGRTNTALKQNTPALKQQGQPTQQQSHLQQQARPTQNVNRTQQNRGPVSKSPQTSHVSNNNGGGKGLSKAGGRGKF